MEKVLFSTLGMTDPVKNDFDGPFLHILRHYRPHKAYLFMTARVCELADQDDRYRIHARYLCEEVGLDCEIVELRYADIVSPQEFDVFYPVFEKELLKIHDANPGCQILINLSSGTPQMKSACNLLAMTAPFPLKPIQVTTPHESENYGSPNFEIDQVWTNNVDNHVEMDPPRRTVEVSSDNLRYLFLREAAIANITAYNYSAAIYILEQVPDFLEPDIMPLLNAAQSRKNMDLNEANRQSRLAGYDMFPVRSGDALALFEYLLVLGLQQQSGQLMDFVRGISPALTILFETFLRERCQRDVTRNYCTAVHNDREHKKIRRYLIENGDPALLSYLDDAFPRTGFRDGDLSCSVLLPIIEFDCRPGGSHPNEDALNRARTMRTAEEKIRNRAAHNITSVRESDFEKLCGISSMKLISDMRWMFKYCCSSAFSNDADIWDSYETMNNYIVRRLKS